jgi:hypothetical protein
MRKKKYFQKLYNFDQESQSYFIDVSLDSYDDVYDEWDPSPFKKRDIEDEFNDFVVNSSEDIPLNYNISVVLYLPSSKRDEKKETNLIAAYQNFYEYETERLLKKKQNLRNKNISHLTMSFSLLTLYFLWEGLSETQTGFFISFPLKEGLMIGGWVFLWEVFTNIFIRGKELRRQFKLYQRLFQANLKFVYID